ncbi:MAG: GDSL-type esterase/lipase family protein [Phenylobacterium sp.]|uniref:GDSL-type esterase/lipase family protein n=1 Tax=Phenylobacterium sp. TaxID=1871053 RepID=UPI002734B4BC|nr:GDSL-type esterase/lipase family protein [Phenylobacterium sp.]MDP3749381.1 GDSL-type esterase/lipase family protein [Phenylobacterium sp.]
MNSGLACAAMAALAAAPPAAGHAQLRPPQNGVGVGDYSLHDFVAKWMMQQDDIPEVRRHRAANQTLIAGEDSRPRIVFLGDSITDHWEALDDRPAEAFRMVNRGIGGQNTSQMLLRFEDDVVALQPAAVVILGGTNDLRAYVGDPASVGPGALERISRNLTAMSDIAAGRGFKVILATLPPVGPDRERTARDAAAVAAVNDWIRGFAAARGYPVADYHAALTDGDGHMPARYSADGIHPNPEGYATMWPALKTALAIAGLKITASGDRP